MKVIGTAGDTYICEVHHTEIEKFMDLYFGRMKRLQVGESIDLGKGCDYASQISDAMRKTRDFVQANQAVVTAILNGLRFEQLPPPSPTETAAAKSI